MFCFNKKYLILLMFLVFVSFVFPRNRNFKFSTSREFSGERFIFENSFGTYDFLENSQTRLFDLKYTNKIKPPLLLNYLVDKNLEGFCKNLEDVLLRYSSYHDLDSKSANYGLVFFLMGLFSSFDESYEFFVTFNIRDGAYTFNKIQILKKGKPLIIIRIAPLGIMSDFLESFDEDNFANIPQINIITIKKKIIYRIKENISFNRSYPESFFIYNSLNSLSKALFDEISIKEFIKNRIFPTFDNFILYESEFHLFLLGLLQNFDGMTELASNKESGGGRPDISLRIENEEGGFDRYIFELKARKIKDKRSIEDYFKQAIRQFTVKKYDKSGSVGEYKSENTHKIVYVFDSETQMFYYYNLDTRDTNFDQLKTEYIMEDDKTPRAIRRPRKRLN
jgi:hypothetical protein